MPEVENCHIISYDKSGDGSYEELHKAIKEFGTWAHITESTWAVVTDWTTKAVRDHLNDFLPDGSRLFVVRSGTAGAWSNVICTNEWLKKNL